jgi:hypothetical protein
MAKPPKAKAPKLPLKAIFSDLFARLQERLVSVPSVKAVLLLARIPSARTVRFCRCV